MTGKVKYRRAKGKKLTLKGKVKKLEASNINFILTSVNQCRHFEEIKNILKRISSFTL